MKLRLLAAMGISASVLLAVACGGASNSDLFAEPGTSSSPTDPSGSGTGESTSSSGATSSSSGSSTTSSSTSSSSSSSGGSSSGGSTSGGIAKDGGPGPTPVTSKIYCGNDPPTSCTAKTQVCCVYFHNDGADLSCESSGIANCIGGTTIACDDRSDCPTNQVCCGMLDQQGYSSVECKSTCQNSPGLKAVRFCDPDAAVDECPAGSYCGDSQSAPGYHVCRN